MSSALRLLRTRIAESGNVRLESGTMVIGEAGKVEFYPAGTSYTELDISEQLGTDNPQSAFVSEYIRGLSVTLDCPDLAVSLLAIMCRNLFRDFTKVEAYDGISVKVTDDDVCVIDWDHDLKRAYFVLENLGLYSDKDGDLDRLKETIKKSMFDVKSTNMLCALPFMCIAEKHPEVWERCKEYYNGTSIYTTQLCAELLRNVDTVLMCAKSFTAEAMNDDWKNVLYHIKMLEDVAEEIQVTRAGRYTLYQKGNSSVVTFGDQMVYRSGLGISFIKSDVKVLLDQYGYSSDKLNW